ncbi:unnamed protein product [Rodentolepis nana]|uniref:DUF4116 domain-containing protein n=1 Tax=Rodentolepis nana TaxID=102285 RepID=A0A0R3T6S4_RODNA|nr:unnamed protein product [Rodentolepis nana]
MSLLSILLLLSISAALNLDRVYEDAEGNIIEACKNDQLCANSPSRSTKKMDKVGGVGRAKKKVTKDCTCDCFPTVSYYCMLCQTDSFSVPTKAEVLIRAMPHIPIDLADTLVFMQPDTVRYVIESHYDLAALVTEAQPDTLVYILSSAPNFSKYLSKMSPHAINTFLHKIPYPCKYLQSIKRVYAEKVVYKVPIFWECLSKTANPTLTTTTEANELTSQPPADVAYHFEKEEWEQMTANWPDTKKYLRKGLNSKMGNYYFTSMVLSLPNLSEVFSRLKPYIISRIFERITYPDRLLSQLDANTARAVLKNMNPNIYIAIWPHIPYTIQRLRLSLNLKPISDHDIMQKVIRSNLLDFPISYADGLYGLDVISLHKVIRNHTDFAALLCRTKPETFNYILSNAPFITEYIVNMTAGEQAQILSKMGYPCVYLQNINLEYARKIIKNLPDYAGCVHFPETIVRTTTTYAPKIRAEQTPWQPIRVESVFTKEELEKMSEKVPKIREILSKINPKTIKLMRSYFPDFMNLFNSFDDNFIKALNTIDFASMTPKARSELILSMAKKNIAVKVFGTIMAP